LALATFAAAFLVGELGEEALDVLGVEPVKRVIAGEQDPVGGREVEGVAK
jgi:hypothetical protein